MKCQWQELLNLLPVSIRQAVDTAGREDAQEVRLRLHTQAQVLKKNGAVWLDGAVTAEDIRFCLNAATRYSPWISGSITQGYITAVGGHRIGLCGQCVYNSDGLKNMNDITSVCIRVARDYPDVSGTVYRNKGSVLIIGAPGSGKTTFLRDLIRKVSDHCNKAVAVVDERRELFPFGDGKYFFERGKNTDVLSGCQKRTGVDMVLRTMGPQVIALDEITDPEDCRALSDAAWCGVQLIATAHAGSKQELLSRKIYRPVIESHIFDTLIMIHPDKSWQEEVLRQC